MLSEIESRTLQNLMDVLTVRQHQAKMGIIQAQKESKIEHAASLGGKRTAYSETIVLIRNALQGIPINAPSAVQLDPSPMRTVKRNKGGMPAKQKRKVMEDGRWCCHYCAVWTRSLEVEHVVPRCLGGTNGMYNLVPSCTSCNAKKASQLIPNHCHKCEKALDRWITQSMQSAMLTYPQVVIE